MNRIRISEQEIPLTPNEEKVYKKIMDKFRNKKKVEAFLIKKGLVWAAENYLKGKEAEALKEEEKFREMRRYASRINSLKRQLKEAIQLVLSFRGEAQKTKQMLNEIRLLSEDLANDLENFFNNTKLIGFLELVIKQTLKRLRELENEIAQKYDIKKKSFKPFIPESAKIVDLVIGSEEGESPNVDYK